ncbi:MAG: hypothetical protein ABIR71_12950 [Chthoniobacterales bacterium]
MTVLGGSDVAEPYEVASGADVTGTLEMNAVLPSGAAVRSGCGSVRVNARS